MKGLPASGESFRFCSIILVFQNSFSPKRSNYFSPSTFLILPSQKNNPISLFQRFKMVFSLIKILKMTRLNINFELEVYDDVSEMAEGDADLLLKARNETRQAYAPYSDFRVAAFARLVNGKTVSGTNQENASFPAGICAERTLMSAAASLYPGVGIDTIAISYHNLKGKSDKPISPCGICRQSFAEFQRRTGHPIRVILSGMQGKVYIIDNIAHLLPLGFGADDMI